MKDEDYNLSEQARERKADEVKEQNARDKAREIIRKASGKGWYKVWVNDDKFQDIEVGAKLIKK